MKIVVGCLALAACSSMPNDVGVDGGGDAPTGTCDGPRGTLHDQKLPAGDGIDTRYYWLHVPMSYGCESPAPLLVDFHGTASGAAPEEAYQTDALIAFADANGVIVARPRSRSAPLEGGGDIYRWDQNPGDLDRNRTFAEHLVTELEAHYAIDPARVYASGFSTGSNMTAQFLSDPASPFRGLAPIAGGIWTTQALPSLADGPRIYMATGYRDYLWPTARTLVDKLHAANLPDDRLLVRRTGGGHDLYAWHFDELWRWLDGHAGPAATPIAAPWTPAALPQPSDVLVFAGDGAALLAAGARGRVWRRTNTTWSVELDRGTNDYTALCAGTTDIVVGGDYAAAHRTHANATWTPDAPIPDYGQLGKGWVNAAACRDDDSVALVGYWSAAVTHDHLASWSKLSALAEYGFEAQMAGAATAPNGAMVLVGYYDYVGRAPHGSATATPIMHPTAAEWWNAATAVAGGHFWVVGDGGAIMVSHDDGLTWSAQPSGTDENLYAVYFADTLHGAAVGRRGTVVVTADGGAHWVTRPLGRDAFLGAVHVDATTITVAGEDGVIATSPR
jgi:poly(3-hydroxybutyrate) depolymerase